MAKENIKAYHLHLEPADYAVFRTHKATRLYDHRWVNGELTVWTSKPYEFAKDIGAAIDFGATTASEVLGLPPKFNRW